MQEIKIKLLMNILFQVKMQYERYSLPICIDELMTWHNLKDYNKEEIEESLESDFISSFIRIINYPSGKKRYIWKDCKCYNLPNNNHIQCSYVIPIHKHIPYKIELLEKQIANIDITKSEIEKNEEIEEIEADILYLKKLLTISGLK